MDLRRCVQALLLLWLSLTAVCGGECVPRRSPACPSPPSWTAADALPSLRPQLARSPPPGTGREPSRSSHAPAARGHRLTGRLGPGTGLARATASSGRGLSSVSGITRPAPCPSRRPLEVRGAPGRGRAPRVPRPAPPRGGGDVCGGSMSRSPWISGESLT